MSSKVLLIGGAGYIGTVVTKHLIKKNFDVTDLKIEDKSFLHSGHKNFREDKYHIKLTIYNKL